MTWARWIGIDASCLLQERERERETERDRKREGQTNTQRQINRQTSHQKLLKL